MGVGRVQVGEGEEPAKVIIDLEWEAVLYLVMATLHLLLAGDQVVGPLSPMIDMLVSEHANPLLQRLLHALVVASWAMRAKRTPPQAFRNVGVLKLQQQRTSGVCKGPFCTVLCKI